MKLNIYFLSKRLIILLFIIGLSNCEDKSYKTNPLLEPYISYFEVSNSIVASYSKEKIKQRNDAIKKLRGTEFYKKVVKNKEINIKNLKILHLICTLIININENGEYSLSFAENRTFIILNDDEKDFIISNINLLSLGGFTPDIVEFFIMYKNKFNYFGKKGNLFYFKDKNFKETPLEDYDLSPFFVTLSLADKDALDAINEAHLLGIRSWETYTLKSPRIFPYLANMSEYQKLLNKVYPNSKNLMRQNFTGSAIGLLNAYIHNEAIADQKYRDKGLLIQGKIIRVLKSEPNGNIIVLSGGRPFFTVACRVPLNEALRVEQGQFIQISGRCIGMKDNSVLLDNCMLN